jgi:two-component system nitrate/nitrite sensor histidine kinase NarX
VENERFLLELEYRSVIEERARLAREIHDGLAQTLAFLKLQASQMQAFLTRGDMHRLHETLETSYKTLTEAYLDTRQAIDNLRVTPQDSMVSWLTQAAEDFSNTTRIPMELSLQVEPEGIPLEVQAQLLRVIQEALNNIRKHARANRASLAMYHWQDDLILEVHDDGQGFSPDDIPQISRYGLRGMRERAEMIGADFQVISSPEKGTTVRIRLPYRLEETPV